MGDYRGIDRIGLGAFAERMSERTHLRRIDNDHWQAGRAQAGRNHRFEAAGGLDANRLGVERSQAIDQGRDTRRVARHREGLAARPYVDIEMVLGNVDPNDDGVHVVPSSCKRASQTAQATVRVR